MTEKSTPTFFSKDNIHSAGWRVITTLIISAVLAIVGVIFFFFNKAYVPQVERVYLNAPNTTTRPTTHVSTCTSATLKGYVLQNGAPTMAWFEWGKTPDLETATPQQAFIRDSNFEQTIADLTENTVYYYSAIATNKYGSTRGEVVTFSTPPC